MNIMMVGFLVTAVCSMIAVNVLFARGKGVDTLFVIALITSFAFAVVAAATGVFAAFDAVSTDAIAKSAAEAVTEATGYFVLSALTAGFAACFTSVVATARGTINHVLMSVGFYACMGASGYLFVIGSSFAF